MSTLVKNGTRDDYSEWLPSFIGKYDGPISLLVTNVPAETLLRRMAPSAKPETFSGLSALSMYRPVGHVLVGVTSAATTGWSIVAEFGALVLISAARLTRPAGEVMGFHYNVGKASMVWAVDGSTVVDDDLTYMGDPCSFAAAVITAATGVLLTPGLEDATFQAVPVLVPMQVSDLQ